MKALKPVIKKQRLLIITFGIVPCKHSTPAFLPRDGEVCVPELAIASTEKEISLKVLALARFCSYLKPFFPKIKSFKSGSK